ncbi:LysM peptidoglycan-binding domain-containing protein [Streptomyces albus subsp. chlorinus]|nr:LysM peptidoglycan-binding domain-containing protein [Streptomyces albus subsp. chlorinus]
MRSGNGRHRRPRQAPAVFVAAGVTGAGIALPLLGATGAHAADASAWDRVADCESGGTWSANDSDGYYGGLKLDLDTWKYYGGTVYAERPDLASRTQQIAVAEKLLEAEGPASFPHCGTALTGDEDGGDGGDRENPATGPGTTPTPPPSPGAGSERDSGDKGGRPGAGDGGETGGKAPGEDSSADSGKGGKDRESGKADPEDKDRKGDKERKGGEDRKGDKGGEESSGPSEEPSAGSGGRQGSDGSAAPGPTGTGSWSDLGPGGAERLKAPSGDADRTEAPGVGKGKHRGKPADEGRDRAGSPDRASRGEGRDGDGGRHRVTVRPGDSLSRLAAEHDVAGGWQELYERNHGVVGDDPDLIRPGQHLRV